MKFFDRISVGDAVLSRVQDRVESAFRKVGKLLHTEIDANGNLRFQIPGTSKTLSFIQDGDGSTVLTIGNSEVDVAVTLKIADGTAAAPSLTFSDDTDTGISRPSDDQLSLSTGGSERVRIEDDATYIESGGLVLSQSSASFPSAIFDDNSIYMERAEAFLGSQGSYRSSWTWNGYRSNDPDPSDRTVLGVNSYTE